MSTCAGEQSSHRQGAGEWVEGIALGSLTSQGGDQSSLPPLILSIRTLALSVKRSDIFPGIGTVKPIHCAPLKGQWLIEQPHYSHVILSGAHKKMFQPWCSSLLMVWRSLMIWCIITCIKYYRIYGLQEHHQVSISHSKLMSDINNSKCNIYGSLVINDEW